MIKKNFSIMKKLTILVSLMFLLCSFFLHAGEVAKNGYELGLYMGFASYQASVQQWGIMWNMISAAQSRLDYLREMVIMPYHKLSSEVRKSSSWHSTLEDLRGEYLDEIKKKSRITASGYQLGLQMGLAEAQAMSPHWSQAKIYALDGLRSIERIVDGALREVKFNRKLLKNAIYLVNYSTRAQAYSSIHRMRKNYCSRINQYYFSNAPKKVRVWVNSTHPALRYWQDYVFAKNNSNKKIKIFIEVKYGAFRWGIILLSLPNVEYRLGCFNRYKDYPKHMVRVVESE